MGHLCMHCLTLTERGKLLRLEFLMRQLLPLVSVCMGSANTDFTCLLLRQPALLDPFQNNFLVNSFVK